MMGEPLVGAQVVLAAGALKGRRIRADAVEHGQARAGAHAQGLEKAGHHGAGGPDAGPDVAENRGADRAREVRQRVVVDDQVIGQAREGLVVRRLGVHHAEAVELSRLFRLPGLGRDAQVTDHGQIVRPGHFVDAHDVHAVHLVQHEPFERHGRGQGVRVGVDHNAPAVVLVQILPPLLETGDIFGIGRHGLSFSLAPSGRITSVRRRCGPAPPAQAARPPRPASEKFPPDARPLAAAGP